MTVIPKPASTVVLMDSKSRVYLIKRPKTMKFLGGFYVFPGGKIEEEDYMIETEQINNLITGKSFDLAHYVAAARELFEEVGVLICTNGDGSTVKFKKATALEYRRLIINKEISFNQMLKQEGLKLHLECLKYIGYRVTPKEKPYRFETRFFLTKLPLGQSPKPDKNEIDNAFWCMPEEAISGYQDGKINLARPTIAAIKTIIDFYNGGRLRMPE